MKPIENSLSRIPAGFEPFELPGKGGVTKPSEGFGDTLGKALNDVNDLLTGADKKASEMAVGKSENLHDAMINFEKAESAFKLLVQVRNRALDAYHEIMRMQV
jgi:flagellar hook-basal body complex protein FliE